MRKYTLLALLLFCLLGLVGGSAYFMLLGGSERSEPRVLPERTEVEPPRPGPRGEDVVARTPKADAAPTAPAAKDELGADPARRGAKSLAERELEAGMWVEGWVALPPDTPPGEVVKVRARGRSFLHRELHEVEVARDGSFRVAFQEKTKTGYLDLVAPHLYTPAPLKLKLRDLPERVEIVARVGGRIAGRFLPPNSDAFDAAAFRQANVSLWGWGQATETSINRNSKIGEDLTFSFDGLPPGIEYQISTSETDCAPVEIESLLVIPGETRNVEHALALGARAKGKIVDEAGEVVGGAALWISHEVGRSHSTSSRSRGLEEGVFDFKGLPVEGKVELIAKCAGYQDGELELGELAEGQTVEDLVIVLERGGSISGVVRWSDGSPAAGAWIEFSKRGGDDFSFGEDRVRADDEGRFEKSGLEGGPFELTASAKPDLDLIERIDPELARRLEAETPTVGSLKLRRRYRGPPWTARVEDVALGSTRVALTLGVGVSVAGRAVDDLGRALTEFRVFAAEYDASSPWRAMVDNKSQIVRSEDGTFELLGLHEGEWSLWATAKDHQDAEQVVVTLPRDSRGHVLLLRRNGSVSGVVHGPDGRPLGGAQVTVTAVGAEGPVDFNMFGQDETDAKTDSGGRFVVDDAPTGTVRAVAALEGLAPSLPHEFELAPGGAASGIVLQLRRGGTITGELVDEGGHSVVGREIDLAPSEGGTWRSTVTDASGRFRFDAVVPAEYEVQAEASEEEAAAAVDAEGETDWSLLHGLRETARVEVVEGETTHVVLGRRSERAVTVSGIVSIGGRPAARARVQAHHPEQSGMRTGVCDENGRYELVVDEPGTYSFQVSGPSHGAQHAHQVEVGAGPTFVRDFELPAGRIAGVVVDERGRPIENVQIVLTREEGAASHHLWASEQTDAEGRFALENLDAGTYSIEATDRSSWWGDTNADLGTERVGDLVLEEGGSLTGVEIRMRSAGRIDCLVRGKDGAPLAGALVFVVGEDGRPRFGSRLHATDANGLARVGALAPGEYTAFATFGSDRSANGGPVRVRSDEVATLELQLLEGAFVWVACRESGGKTVGAQISITDAAGRSVGENWYAHPAAGAAAPSDEGREGQRFGPLPAGRYRIEARNKDGTTAERTVDLKTGGREQVVLTLGG